MKSGFGMREMRETKNTRVPAVLAKPLPMQNTHN